VTAPVLVEQARRFARARRVRLDEAARARTPEDRAAALAVAARMAEGLRRATGEAERVGLGRAAEHAAFLGEVEARAARKRVRRSDPKRTRRGQRVCPVGTSVQSLVFSRDKFTPDSARQWALKHRMSARKVHATNGSIRIRQRPPSSYVPGSFRTIDFAPGVKAVIGCPSR
jgi:hypothetical protein